MNERAPVRTAEPSPSRRSPPATVEETGPYHRTNRERHGQSNARLGTRVQTIEINFGRGRQALAALLLKGSRPVEALRALGIRPGRALLFIAGGAGSLDLELQPRLRHLFGRGLARAARRTAATVIDGGTDAGVMAVLGQTLAVEPGIVHLLGVAPAGAVTYPGGPEPRTSDAAPLEPNHPSFVLVEGQAWGDETAALFALAEAACPNGRAATIVVGGGEGARDEVLRSVRRAWPVVVVEGSQGFADELAAALRERPEIISDPILAEIVADGKLHVAPIDVEATQLETLLVNLLSDAETLRYSWERFATYDHNAVVVRRQFQRLQNGILLLGVLGTLLVLAQAQWQAVWQSLPVPWAFGEPPGITLADVIRGLILLVPITISALAAILGRTKVATQWVLLRGTAESIKREIFRYRARAGAYSDHQTMGVSREAKLARQVATLSRRLIQTEVNTADLEPYTGPVPPIMAGASGTDDALSFLTPERYVAVRIGDQLSYYRGKAHELARRITRLQWLILLAGGAGTFLAAVQHELWVALATAVVTALAAYLQYQQLEYTLVKYNQVETSLANVRAWWLGLTPSEQADPRKLDRLVEATEQILDAEVAGWVQQMHDALAKLEADQQSEDDHSPGERESSEDDRVWRVALGESRRPSARGEPARPRTGRSPQ